MARAKVCEAASLSVEAEALRSRRRVSSAISRGLAVHAQRETASFPSVMGFSIDGVAFKSCDGHDHE